MNISFSQASRKLFAQLTSSWTIYQWLSYIRSFYTLFKKLVEREEYRVENCYYLIDRKEFSPSEILSERFPDHSFVSIELWQRSPTRVHQRSQVSIMLNKSQFSFNQALKNDGKIESLLSIWFKLMEKGANQPLCHNPLHTSEVCSAKLFFCLITQPPWLKEYCLS